MLHTAGARAFWIALLKALWRWIWEFVTQATQCLKSFLQSNNKPSHAGWRMHPVRRKASGWGVNSRTTDGSRYPHTKPNWVHGAFFKLADALPEVGCRTLACNFNQLHKSSKVRISKTWAYERLKARRHVLALARASSPSQERSGAIGAIQRVWGVDLTGLPLVTGDSIPVWGIVDHGGRIVLQLEPLARYNSLILLGKLLMAMGEYGKPKAVRSDNASVFKTILFRTMLKLLGVNQQFTELHSPWQNGRIERFWRTLKETLGTKVRRFRQETRILEEQMRFASTEAMKEVLQEFQAFYNFSRPHQSLKGRTPAQVWNAQVQKRKSNANAQAIAHASKRRRAKTPDP